MNLTGVNYITSNTVSKADKTSIVLSAFLMLGLIYYFAGMPMVIRKPLKSDLEKQHFSDCKISNSKKITAHPPRSRLFL